MEIITKLSVAAIALIAVPTSAYADCPPSLSGTTSEFTIDLDGCSVKVLNTETLPIVPGMEIVVIDPTTDTIGSDGGKLINSVNSALASKAATDFVNSENDAQDVRLDQFNGTSETVEEWATSTDNQVDQNKTDIDTLETEKADKSDTYTKKDVDDANDLQNEEINKKADTEYVDGKNKDQDEVIATKASTAYVDAENDAQDTRLDGHDTQLGDHNARLNAHDVAIGDLENGVSANSAAISNNSKAIKENAAGVAIALSMPDAFLDSTENFSIAAGFGGFDSETAFGVIGSARLDQTWSLYGGGGMSTNGNNFGWKAGARAGW